MTVQILWIFDLKVGLWSRRRQKYRVLTRIFLTLKKSCLITKAFLFLTNFNENWDKGTSDTYTKILRLEFDSLLLWLFTAQHNCKNCQFRRSSHYNSTKMKNSKICSDNFFVFQRPTFMQIFTQICQKLTKP